MRIYRLLIMFGHVMSWAFDWAIVGRRPSPGPTIWLLRALGSWLVMF